MIPPTQVSKVHLTMKLEEEHPVEAHLEEEHREMVRCHLKNMLITLPTQVMGMVKKWRMKTQILMTPPSSTGSLEKASPQKMVPVPL